jgi:hypothetical protein
MMGTVPTREPRDFTAGETVIWSKSLDDYSGSDGWALDYYFRGAGSFDVSAAAQADGSFLATVAPDAVEAAGRYYWQGWVSKGGEKHVVANGECEVKPGLAGDVDAYDGRSNAKKILDAIDALLAGKASLDQQEYTISDGDSSRTLRRIPPGELLELRKTYARIVARERRRERVRRGGTLMSNVKVRFDRPR